MSSAGAGRIVSLDELVVLVTRARGAGQRVALANGAFDLLHVGHIRYLRAAAAEAERLVVAVNSDASVARLKGPGRPLVPEAERAELVAAIAGVDWVLLFDSDTVAPVIRAIRPDLQLKGTDYSPDSVPEAALVRSLGGEVRIVGDPKDHSSSALIASLR